jgi:hypothetical protein
VDDADLDTWRAIDRGERLIDWEAWFGDPSAADYLSDKGRQVMRRAVADLTAFFGPTWLNRAMQPDLGLRGARIRGLGRSSPVFALAPARRAGAYVESIRWWASLRMLAEDHVPGFGAVRSDVRNDVTTQRLMHTLAQARLAVIGAHIGAQVAVEPGKAGGPGDVLLRTTGEDVFLEIVTFGPDEKRELEEAHQQRHWMHLMMLARAPVYWEGYVPGFLNKADEAKWLQATTDAANSCLRTGQPEELTGPDGKILIVRPGKQPAGTRTFGPNLNMDFTARLAHVLDKKGAQTRGAGLAWIWIEDCGGVHAVHPFAKMPLLEKMSMLADITRQALAGRPHVAGISWSAAFRCFPLLPDEQVVGQAGVALQRGLPIEHVRQTAIVNRGLILPGQTRVLTQICDREPRWLDWALSRLGIQGGIKSLLAESPQTQPSRLWTPGSRS